MLSTPSGFCSIKTRSFNFFHFCIKIEKIIKVKDAFFFGHQDPLFLKKRYFHFSLKIGQIEKIKVSLFQKRREYNIKVSLSSSEKVISWR